MRPVSRAPSVAFVIRCFLAVIVSALFASALDAQTSAGPNTQRPQISQGTLQNGDMAPELCLHDTHGKNELTLVQLRGKPVVLIFGSCTCPPFVASLKAAENLYARFKDQAHFYIIYIREAHPSDGWALPNNQFQISTPKSLEERQSNAEAFAKRLNIPIPIFVDTIDDQAEKAYAPWPNRMYIISSDGKIADKGFAGPRGVATAIESAHELLASMLSASQ